MELADVADSKSADSDIVWVRLPPSPPDKNINIDTMQSHWLQWLSLYLWLNCGHKKAEFSLLCNLFQSKMHTPNQNLVFWSRGGAFLFGVCILFSGNNNWLFYKFLSFLEQGVIAYSGQKNTEKKITWNRITYMLQ